MKIDDLLEKAEGLGWSAYEDDGDWELSQYSPAGEDFAFCISKREVSNPQDFVREIRSYANDFDPEEHATMWAEAKKNGVGGVPSLHDLAKDADDLKLMLNKLASAMEDALNGKTEEEDKGELPPRQIERLDEIDNAMYEFLLVLLEKDADEFPWDMYHIGEAVDAVQQVMLDHGFDIHRPYIEDDGENRAVREYERATTASNFRFEYVSKQEATEIIENRSRRGWFVQEDNGTFIGIDNSTGNAWTEEFRDLSDCLSWLSGEKEVGE